MIVLPRLTMAQLGFMRLGVVKNPIGWHYERLGGHPTVVIHCPQCSGPGVLADHAISDDGTVNPGMGCSRCGYETAVKLDQFVRPA